LLICVHESECQRNQQHRTDRTDDLPFVHLHGLDTGSNHSLRPSPHPLPVERGEEISFCLRFPRVAFLRRLPWASITPPFQGCGEGRMEYP
jgi:hypothetical protein